MRKFALRILPAALLLMHSSLYGQAADPAKAPAGQQPTQQLIAQSAAETPAVSPHQQQMLDLALAQPDSTEAVWLETNSESFLGLFERAAAAEAEGAALILHDNGEHPDWPILVNGLRMGLADQGWHTLAIELPLIPEPDSSAALTPAPQNAEATAEADTPSDAIFTELSAQTLARINAALDRLNQESPIALTLIGIGTGGYWATQHFKDQQPELTQTLTLIDTKAPRQEMAESYNKTLAETRVRTLDLYHGNPAPNDAGFLAAKQRLNASKRAQRVNYVQRRLPVRPNTLALDNERLIKTFLGAYRKQLELEEKSIAAAAAAAALQ